MIDWTQVTELRDQIGADEMDEVISLFIEEVEESIERLRTNPQTSTLGEDLHFLKGSAMSLGFREFSNLCGQGEKLAEQGAEDKIDLGIILSSYDASKALFMAQKAEKLAA